MKKRLHLNLYEKVQVRNWRDSTINKKLALHEADLDLILGILWHPSWSLEHLHDLFLNGEQRVTPENHPAYKKSNVKNTWQ